MRTRGGGGPVGELFAKVTAGGFNDRKVKILSSRWTKFLELGVFYARKRHVFPIAIGTLLDPRRNSMKPEGLFKKTARVAGVTRDVGSEAAKMGDLDTPRGRGRGHRLISLDIVNLNDLFLLLRHK
jgi:hypothetical protein